jgi:carboxymethylenebutenolidase
MLAVVTLQGDKLASERIYWDQASVLVQVGLLDPAELPMAGMQTARKVLDPALPSNTLMSRWKESEGKSL